MGVLTSSRVPIIQAPMAGGISTPRLAAAVIEAGGIGFLAAGYQSPEAVGAEISALRELTGGPFGVNVFVPVPAGDPAEAEEYRRSLRDETERYGVALGAATLDDDAWDAKIELLLDLRVPIISFTFGCPAPYVVKAFQEAGTCVVLTVNRADEVAAALAVGADALCVQGVEAGGHQGGFGARTYPAADNPTLLPLLREIASVTDIPLLAAGGISHGSEIADVLAAGAVAAQVGTLFIPCEESGANPAYKAAFDDPSFETTTVTSAFTGRPARGLLNRFIQEHDADAPQGVPQIHNVTSPLRKAAAAAGDAGGLSLWAGTGHRHATASTVGAVMERLEHELAAAS